MTTFTECYGCNDVRCWRYGCQYSKMRTNYHPPFTGHRVSVECHQCGKPLSGDYLIDGANTTVRVHPHRCAGADQRAAKEPSQ